MGVDNLYEMYSLLWSWNQYGVIWELMKTSGLAFVPFFGLVLNATTSTLTSQNPKDAAFISMRIIEFKFIMAMIIIVIAVEPTVSLRLNDITFTKTCFDFEANQKQSRTFKPKNGSANPETKLDALNMIGFEETKIPAWWFAVFSVSNGIVRAGIETIPCINDIRKTIDILNTAITSDASVNNSLKDFYKHCYYPAKINLKNNRDALLQDKKFQESLDLSQVVYKTDFDVWLGTAIFTKHLYQVIRPNDSFIIPPGVEIGNGTCADIWGGQNGLRNKILSELDREYPDDIKKREELFEEFKDNLNVTLLNPNDLLDLKFYVLLRGNFKDRFGGLDRLALDTSSITPSTFTTSATRLTTEVGAFIKGIQLTFVNNTVARTIPALISLTLMAVTVFLPFGLIFSGYSLGFLITASIGFLTIKLFNYLYTLSFWLDQNFVKAMQEDSFRDAGVFSFEIIQILAASTYIIFPSLLTIVLGWTAKQSVRAAASSSDQLMQSMVNYSNTQQSAYSRLFETPVLLHYGQKAIGIVSSLIAKSNIEIGHRAQRMSSRELRESEHKLDELNRLIKSLAAIKDSSLIPSKRAIKLQGTLNKIERMLEKHNTELEKEHDNLAESIQQLVYKYQKYLDSKGISPADSASKNRFIRVASEIKDWIAKSKVGSFSTQYLGGNRRYKEFKFSRTGPMNIRLDIIKSQKGMDKMLKELDEIIDEIDKKS